MFSVVANAEAFDPATGMKILRATGRTFDWVNVP
jgi:hypothetical protein